MPWNAASSRPTFFFAFLGASAAGCYVYYYCWYHHGRQRRRSPSSFTSTTSTIAYELLIGNTPCVLLPQLSRLLHCEIYVKLESANPGSTGKDRAAMAIMQVAEADGRLPAAAVNPSAGATTKKKKEWSLKQTATATNNTITTYKNDDLLLLYDQLIAQAMQRSTTGGLVVEGTSGSTGISLATLAACRGHACLVVLPDDQAAEKTHLLKTIGAITHTVPTASIASPQHYVNIAQAIAQRAYEIHGIQTVVFGNQFENLANWKIHYETTGPEIWRQCRPDCFVMSAGTGGTLSGVARYLKEQNTNCKTVLVDPPGSVLFNKVEHGVAFASQQRESQLLRHRYDTIAEGIGLDRVTRNFAEGLSCIDCAIAVTDQEAVDLAHWILRNEGLLLGSSSAMNLVGACQVAQVSAQESKRICTVICDTGQRHLTRFWNRDFLVSRGLRWPGDDDMERIPHCLQPKSPS